MHIFYSTKNMPAEIIKLSENTIEIKVLIKLSNNMLESEENIQKGCNEVGKIATTLLLKNFDTDGTNIILGKTILYSKGKRNVIIKRLMETLV